MSEALAEPQTGSSIDTQPRTTMTASADESRQVVVDGRQIHYRSAGAGPAVVLIHGWPTSAALWRHQIPILATRMRVYAPDLPGFGESPPFAEDRCTWDGYVETVVGLLDAVGERKVSLVGHDIGASVALLTAIRHPERVERLAVLDTTPFPRMPWIIRALVAAVKTPLVGRLVTTRVGFHVLFRLGTGNPRTSVPELVDLYRGPVSTPRARRALREILAELDPSRLVEIEHGLNQVECPVLVLWGDRDVSGPLEVARRLHEGLQGSSLRIVPGGGHFLPEDAPDEVGQALLTFLPQQSAEPASVTEPRGQ